jgi:DNA-binding XRE family transcriptional regulator
MRKFKVDDISLYDDAKKRDEEFFPAARIKSIMDGVSPVKVYRTHRGLTQRALAAGMGISRSYLAEIESGKKRGLVTVLCRAATVLTVLNVDLDMLVTDWVSHENKPA